MRCRLRCLWYAPPALLVLVLVCELLLQLGALLAQGQSRLVPEQWRLVNRTRVLALGDSNTYGLYLKEEESWPAQLERSWNIAHPQSRIEVLNLGYPATNSFRVLDNLPALLNKLSPDIVLIMVGFNDFWTAPEILPTAAQPSGMVTAFNGIKSYSRLYRLYAIWLRSRITQGDMMFGSPRDITKLDLSKRETHLLRMKSGDEFFMGIVPGEPARNRHALPENLQAMIAIARQHKSQIYLMTYPSNWGFYPGANKWIREVAQRQEVTLIDITPLFIARCVNGYSSCDDLMFHDGHATAKGNALVAEKVQAVLNMRLN